MISDGLKYWKFLRESGAVATRERTVARIFCASSLMYIGEILSVHLAGFPSAFIVVCREDLIISAINRASYLRVQIFLRRDNWIGKWNLITGTKSSYEESLEKKPGSCARLDEAMMHSTLSPHACCVCILCSVLSVRRGSWIQLLFSRTWVRVFCSIDGMQLIFESSVTNGRFGTYIWW